MIETAGNALWVSPLTFVEASTPGTGGFFESADQRVSVQHVSPITTLAQLSAVPVEGNRDQGLRLGDVSSVVVDHQPLIGDALFLRGSTCTTITLLGLGAAVCIVIDVVVHDIDAARRGIAAHRGAEGASAVPLPEAIRASAAAVRGPLVLATVAIGLATLPFIVLGQTVTAFSGPLVLTFMLAVLTSLWRSW